MSAGGWGFRFVDKMNCNPILLRLAWHDAGTYDKSKSDFGDRGGANGSIRFSPEITMGANNGLDKAVKYLEPFKAGKGTCLQAIGAQNPGPGRLPLGVVCGFVPNGSSRQH